MLRNGKRFLEKRHDAPGAPLVKSRLESIDVRWRTVVERSENRQASLENAFSNRFQEEVKRVTLWINQKSKDVDKIDNSPKNSKKTKTYVQVKY